MPENGDAPFRKISKMEISLDGSLADAPSSVDRRGASCSGGAIEMFILDKSGWLVARRGC